MYASCEIFLIKEHFVRNVWNKANDIIIPLRRRIMLLFASEQKVIGFFCFLFFSFPFLSLATRNNNTEQACKNSCVTHRNWSLSDEHERANSRFAVSTISRPRYARHTLRIIESLPSMRCNSNESPNCPYNFFFLFFFFILSRSKRTNRKRNRPERNFHFHFWFLIFSRRRINRRNWNWSRWLAIR